MQESFPEGRLKGIKIFRKTKNKERIYPEVLTWTGRHIMKKIKKNTENIFWRLVLKTLICITLYSEILIQKIKDQTLATIIL